MLQSIAEANHAEVSKQLDELRVELARTHEKMQKATDAQVAALFETMAEAVVRTSAHCNLRMRVEVILRSLLFDTISDRESGVPDAHQGTFAWAFDDTKTSLPTWLRSGKGVFWIEGKAGSGKSTLMKFLEQDPRGRSMLEEWAGEGGADALTVVSHYFWAPGTEMQRSLVGLFRTLLFKILVRNPHLAEQACPSRMRADGFGHVQPWTLNDLERCFQNLSRAQGVTTTRICIFVDGLDEFEGDHDRLVRIIKSISESESDDLYIKLCVASRPWVPFQKAFEASSQKLAVHHFTQHDIEIYAQDSLQQSDDFQELREKSPTHAEMIVSEISTAADGVFIWVYLVVRELVRGLSNKDSLLTLQKRLRAIPKDLNEYFDRMLKSIEDVYWDEARSMLAILAYTRLPLDTHLTTAHRRSRDFLVLSSHNLLRFPSHGDDDAMARVDQGMHDWEQRLMERQLVGLDDPSAERKRILARCRDLVYVGENKAVTSPGKKPALPVTFLHRTVADFMVPALAKLSEAEGTDSLTNSLLPIMALAETYIEARTSEEDWLSDRDLSLWILSLALEAKQHSQAAYLYIVRFWCIYFGNNHHIESIFGTVMAAGVSVNGCCCNQQTLTEAYDGLFWALHCRECLGDYTGVDLSYETIQLFFRFCRVPYLREDGTVGVRTLPEVDIGLMERWIKVLGIDLSSNQLFKGRWRTLLEEIRMHAIRRSTTSATALQVPVNDLPGHANLFDVLLLCIRNGAPRFPDGPKLDALEIISTLPSAREADPTGSVLKRAFTQADRPEKQHTSWFQGMFGNWGRLTESREEQPQTLSSSKLTL